MSDLQSADDLKAAAMKSLEDSSTSTDNGEPTASPADQPVEPAAPVVDTPAASAEPTPPADPAPAATDDGEGKKDWQVPGERLQEVVAKNKKLEEDLASERERIAELEASRDAKPGEGKDPENDDDDDEDEVELLPGVKKALEKDGYVRADKVDQIVEAKLAAREQAAADREQAVRDKQELTTWAKDKGYPEFKIDEVLPKAVELFGENNINRAALQTAYRELYEGDIENILIKQAQAKASAPDATAERPGGSPSVKSDGPTKTGADATKEKIAAAIVD